MLSSIKRMLSLFEEQGIVYCHWKSNEHLLPALEGDTDLDMLFLPEQRAQLEMVLNSCGLKRFRSTPLSQYNAIEDFIGFDIETAKIWHLHLHYRMTLGEKNLKGYTITPWTKFILDNRIYDESGCYISSHETELMLLLVRMSLKLRIIDIASRVGEDDIREIEWLLERVDSNKLKDVLNELFDSKTAMEIYELSEKKISKKSSLFRLRNILRKSLRPFTAYSIFSSWFVSSIRSVYSVFGGVIRRCNLNSSKPTRRVSPSGGTVVAFLGSDGAGKTTTIKYVKKEFSKKIDVKTVYLGSGDGECSILRLPMRYVAKKVGGRGLGSAVEKEYQEKKESSKKISLKSRMYSVAKVIWAVTLAKEKRAKLRKITKARNKGMLVLIDRYPQVEYPGYGDGPLLSKYLSNGKGFLYRQAMKEYGIYESALRNRPDVFIKLVVPTEVAIQRKPEMTAEEIELKKNAVLALFADYESVVVDSSVEKNESFGKVMDAIWKII